MYRQQITITCKGHGNQLKCMWPLGLFVFTRGRRPAKTRLRPGIASGRGPLLHRRDPGSQDLARRPLPLFVTQTTTTERIRDIQSHGGASAQQTPPSNHPDLAYCSPTFHLEPCNTPISTTRSALTRPINIIPPACRGDATVRSWNGANLRPRHSSSCLP